MVNRYLRGRPQQQEFVPAAGPVEEVRLSKPHHTAHPPAKSPLKGLLGGKGLEDLLGKFQKEWDLEDILLLLILVLLYLENEEEDELLLAVAFLLLL